MPCIRIDWVKGRTAQERDEVARRVSAAMSEVTGIPGQDVWVVFQEVEAEGWYVGQESIADIRKKKGK